jgi:hypothetical protein
MKTLQLELAAASLRIGISGRDKNAPQARRWERAARFKPGALP